MSRTIDDYDSMARREIIKAKQEKATSYVPLLQATSTPQLTRVRIARCATNGQQTSAKVQE
jgi:Golgi SNAP receptor complex protein 2